jgi:hypothetical protein
MTNSTQFIATGPTKGEDDIAFQTNPPDTNTQYLVGVDVSGLAIGVKGTGTEPTNGAGVQGNGSGTGWGVSGFGGNAARGTIAIGATQSAGVLGQGGQGPQAGAPGVVGIGASAAGAISPPPTIPAMRPGFPGAGMIGQGGANLGEDGEVLGAADGVRGYGAGNFSGVAGFGDPTAGGNGVFGQGGGPPAPPPGQPAAPGGPGVKGIGGSNQFGGADGVQGFGGGTFSGVSGFGSEQSGTGVFGLGGGTNGPGVRGIAAGAAITGSTRPVGVYGQGGPVGDGIQGIGSVGVRGISAGSDGDIGVTGEAGPNCIAIAGLANEGGEAGFFGGPVVVEGELTVSGAPAALFEGEVTVAGDFTVTGAKSAAVPHPDGTHRRLYCMESPESWFEDFGIGCLEGDRVAIALDPDFAATVKADDYHVFISEYGDNHALFVSGRTESGFEVCARTPVAHARFSYRVVARRKDIEAERLAPVALTRPGRLKAAR